MNGKGSAPIIVLLVAAGILAGQSASTAGRSFDNHYLTITILGGWTLNPSADQRLNLVKGKYVLTINPIFTHASPVEGGRFYEIVQGMPSLDAVTANVDQPAGSNECAQYPSEVLTVTKSISLGNLYTDSSKVGNGCIFPSSGASVWFGSFFSGPAPESEFTITLAYETADVNQLPKKGSPELTAVFTEVAAMLKTLHLKPPIVVSRVDPQSAPPGATVTIYGDGFNLINQTEVVSFLDFPNNSMPNPVVAEDGKSMTFEVPTSIDTVSCPAGQVEVKEFCVPPPANHVDVNDCPRKSGGGANFCGVPMPPGRYQISVMAGGSGVSGGPVQFTVAAPKPSPVSISLMYPNYLVSAGDTITVRGSGFSASGNTVRIGSAVVDKLSSPDGTTLTFQAPAPAGTSLIRGIRIFKASVSNANGESNSISFDYR
jgi:hypothetical protein